MFGCVLVGVGVLWCVCVVLCWCVVFWRDRVVGCWRKCLVVSDTHACSSLFLFSGFAFLFCLVNNGVVGLVLVGGFWVRVV